MNLGYRFGELFGQGFDAAIMAMLVACLLPFVWTIVGKLMGGFRDRDNADPRAFWARSTGLASRANAAQANSFETLPMFLAAVIVAMQFFVPQQVINGIAWLYVLLRVAYGLAYLKNWALLRSVIWALSLGCILMLFILATRMTA